MNIDDLLASRVSRLAIRLMGAWALIDVAYGIYVFIATNQGTVDNAITYGLLAGVGTYFLLTGKFGL